MLADDYSTFQIEANGPVVLITLRGNDEQHRYPPSALNLDLARLGAELRTDEGARALIITGTDDIFSLGGLPRAVSNEDPEALGPDLSKNTVRYLLREFLDLDLPVITALNGPIMGGVLAFVLLSDIIIAEEHATIQDMHVTTGRPSTSGPFFWPPAVGLMQARRYLLTGDRLTAREAERIGLVTEVVPRGASLARAFEFAEKFASLSPSAVGGTKRALNQWLKTAFSSIFDAGVAIQFLAMAQPGFSPQGMEELQDQEFRRLRG